MRKYTLYEQLPGEEPRLMATLFATIGGEDSVSLGEGSEELSVSAILEAFAEAVDEML